MRRQQMHLAKSRDSEVWQETLGKRNQRDSASADLSEGNLKIDAKLILAEAMNRV